MSEKNYIEGEQILLIDSKKRRYLIELKAGGEFHTHVGAVLHDDLIGLADGSSLKSNRGGVFSTVRPTMSDFVLKMPRGAQVIYPKDLGPILMLADLFPGAQVFESGVGSGALSMTMLRAGVNITGYEIREDFAERAKKNVKAALGEKALDQYDVLIRDAYEGIEEKDFDRMVLDLPEPWNVVPHAKTALRSGGIILAYTPSILQAAKFKEALEGNGFALIETMEVMNRTWHIEGQAVRPDHRMVAHTAFLTHARLLST
ncbi:MAG: tRNA (adenine-N1)-methyltransferase [Acidimicrobiales bacterium]|jgi:tRNA (adenine57-N1/adenine58-N1)-methyltransferase|nr:tRNA (adenine-N1)-methyltransferase [Acidimicrobiales bacterium]